MSQAGALLAGCGGSSSSVPVTAPQLVAGEFAGPVIDSVAGRLSGDLVLAQHGAGLGGAMTLTAGSSTDTESVTLALSGAALSGTGVMDVNGAACTFVITGTYANNAISASYLGVSGCTRTGTWSLAQTCAGTTASLGRRVEGFVPAC